MNRRPDRTEIRTDRMNEMAIFKRNDVTRAIEWPLTEVPAANEEERKTTGIRYCVPNRVHEWMTGRRWHSLKKPHPPTIHNQVTECFILLCQSTCLASRPQQIGRFHTRRAENQA